MAVRTIQAPKKKTSKKKTERSSHPKQKMKRVEEKRSCQKYSTPGLINEVLRGVDD